MSSAVLTVANLDITKLSAVYLQVDMEFDNRKNAAYGVLNMLSRDLLHTCESFGGCLSSPERDLRTILLIIEKEKQKNEVLIEFLKTQRITKKMETDCDSFAIEKCLAFSIFWFLEKANWFRLGKCFVHQGFLEWQQTRLNRIQSTVHCTSAGRIYLKFSSEIVKIYPFEHCVLDADERFNDLSEGPVTHSIRHRWVSCLPKLGKGKIVKVHRKVPESSPFENYNQMRSYWKKVYGYELPSKEPEVYYDVMFNNGHTMLYPMTCVLTTAPEVIPIRANLTMMKEGLELFLKSFKEADIVICGTKIDPTTQSSHEAEAYLNCMSMISHTRLKKEEKKSRNASEIPKVYPKIPVGVKRSISSSSPIKKKRPGCGITFE